MSAAEWTPQKPDRARKLPEISVADCDLIQKYLDWFNQNPGIPRTVPPIYRDFTLSFSRSFDGRTHDYIEIIHYDDDLCGFWACHLIDGKKVLTIHSDYADYADKTIKAEVHAPSTTRFTEDWLRNEGTAVACTVLAVQMYILYHRPDVIPVELPAPTKSNIINKKTADSPPRKIADTKKVYIRLAASDPEPRKINYQKIQWQVRGHYRHLPSGKLIYIKPHTAKRGWKKTAAPKIEMQ